MQFWIISIIKWIKKLYIIPAAWFSVNWPTTLPVTPAAWFSVNWPITLPVTPAAWFFVFSVNWPIALPVTHAAWFSMFFIANCHLWFVNTLAWYVCINKLCTTSSPHFVLFFLHFAFVWVCVCVLTCFVYLCTFLCVCVCTWVYVLEVYANCKCIGIGWWTWICCILALNFSAWRLLTSYYTPWVINFVILGKLQFILWFGTDTIKYKHSFNLTLKRCK